MDDITYVKKHNLDDTGFAYTMNLIKGKYKVFVLYALSLNDQPMRYNSLKRTLGKISFKTLTNTLRELENDDLIVRKEYPQVPPKVEYSLTKRGRSLVPVMDAICTWGEKEMKKQI
ncbi:winged helix-turn-helix transcriptional regulator [Companilactobacillus sp. HBUAS59699]|uniref:winged helix-turn-helix transcriptional regulator n=1 Tax=Companilactobacillus sp. HBUAS59699 TaxID=3109358 RepID=UPI002FF0082B